MKKLFITATVAGSLLSSMAIAKTEGSYIGLDAIHTTSEVYSFNKNKLVKESDISLGANYKYAINFNNFFVAPGVFYNHNNNEFTENTATRGTVETELKYSYGVKLDLGYDITDEIAAFATIGHSESRIGLEQTNNGIYVTGTDLTQEAFLYGLGVKYSITNDIDLGAAYEISQYNKSDDLLNTTDSFNSDYHVAKVGVAFKF